MFLLILMYYLTTSPHHSQQHMGTFSAGALNTWQSKLGSRSCATKHHLQLPYVLSWHLHTL